MIKIGIVGGTGYTGVELLRILATHPQAQIAAITSRKEAGMPVAEVCECSTASSVPKLCAGLTALAAFSPLRLTRRRCLPSRGA